MNCIYKNTGKCHLRNCTNCVKKKEIEDMNVAIKEFSVKAEPITPQVRNTTTARMAQTERPSDVLFEAYEQLLEDGYISSVSDNSETASIEYIRNDLVSFITDTSTTASITNTTNATNSTIDSTADTTVTSCCRIRQRRPSSFTDYITVPF